MPAKITHIEYYLPERILTNQDLTDEFADWNVEKIEKKTGVRQRHIVDETETALDLAYKASLKILEKFDKDKIDFLLMCTQSPDYYLPTGACILQHQLGLRNNIGAFDFNLGCSGFIYGLATAKSLIAAGISECILLVASETYTKHIHPKDRRNKTIFGDAAAAIIIQRSKDEGIMHFSLGTDGSGYANLIVENGGLRNRYDKEAKEIIDESGNIRTKNNLYMNGPEIFNFTVETMPKVLSDVIKKNNLRLDEIDYFIFHQANEFIIEYLREKMGISKEKFCIDLLQTGNTVSASIPMALKNAWVRNIVKPDDKILLMGFGVGYSWGGVVVVL